jgi:hypothetical protein
MNRVVFLAAVLLAATLPACFNPEQPACAFSCVTAPHACPPNYACQSDGLCHNDKSPGICMLDPIDGASGASISPDASD